ncbi:C5a anaphylatoxin chemotactic receptor 1 [Misgurnus anguillicaudatus]|uniref:C5a anaphylatoxin chemotactic receptor 1 n=1 Tax=Misgurnus anguillicaudatus TaxID=75329 RepID=UPI003CCF9891
MEDEFEFDFDFNYTECEGCEDIVVDPKDLVPTLGVQHWVALICYSIVFLLGVPGNGLVVWVTAFRMPNSVNAQWFLNLAIADLLCCLSLPMLMVPLAQDQHWPFGPLACKVLHGLFYMMMYCSVLLLVVISLDRLLLVTKPVWCQNHRNTKVARCTCLAVWLLALLGSSPQFAHRQEEKRSMTKKILCGNAFHSHGQALAVTLSRFLLSFVLPFLIICVSHWKVYQTSKFGRGHRGNNKSARTLRVILVLVSTFFLCWIPLHIVDILEIILHDKLALHASLHLAQVLTLCLAYINSCLNPLLYVCLGRGFKENLISSLRSVLHFASEAPISRNTMTASSKTTTDGNICREKSQMNIYTSTRI